MKRMAIAITLLLAAAALLAPAGAQEAAPKPDFDNAAITEVLLWAQKSIGCGFVYDGASLNDPATGQIRRITAKQVDPQTKAEKTLLLFELLRRCGLVPFEVGGMPGPTYHLYTADGAARNAVIFNEPAELEGMYFAALSIRLKHAPVQSVAPRIREKLTPSTGSVEVFEDTHSMIVTDYVDRLLVAWDIAQAAEAPAPRDDDLVVQDFVATAGAVRLAAAIERLREADESWKSTVNETANVVLISGPRAQVSTVIQRLTLLDKHAENAAYKESTQTIKLIYLTPAEAVNALREMFEHQVAAGSVQIGGFDRDRKVVFRGTEYDLGRAQATIKVLDTKPEK
jgi:type II secretory pathway component GspD/PulD (secretin)